MKPSIIVATRFCLISSAILGVPTVSFAAMEDTEKGSPRSSLYKGEVIVHEEKKLIMKDANGQAIELHLGEDTLIKGRPGARFRPGDLIEADVTPEGHAKSIRPMR
jgi:hypothetical protein